MGLVVRMMFYHLTGSLRGRTQSVDADSVAFGVGPNCGILFDRAADTPVSPLHAELSVEDHVPIIRDRSEKNALLINGRQKTEAALKDGDLLQFGEGGPLVRFRLFANGAPATKPFRTIVADSRDIVVRTPHPRYLSPLYLARHMLADIARHASPTVKVVAALAVVVPVLLILALGVALYKHHQAAAVSERRLAELISQLETGRLTQEEMERRIERERQIAEELRRHQEELVATLTATLKKQEATRESLQEIRALRQQLAALQQAHNFAEDIARRFETGVGLVQGGYGFREKSTGRLLRYRGFDQLGNPLVDKDGNALVTVEGTAPPVVIFYAGTAFLVEKTGTVITNRHLVRMWEAFEPAQQAIASGFDPELTILRLFLPGETEPYNLSLIAVSDRIDLAILHTDRAPASAALLPLEPTGEKVQVGEAVVLLSYPGTFDTLLARVPKQTSNEILAAAGGHPIRLADEVAKRRLVRPLVTQGHVSNVSPEVITYDTASASGASGGPVLNRAGEVIAVNYAVLQRIGGVHLGVPIRFAKELLAVGQRPSQ